VIFCLIILLRRNNWVVGAGASAEACSTQILLRRAFQEQWRKKTVIAIQMVTSFAIGGWAPLS
jgi:hypothetical protein